MYEPSGLVSARTTTKKTPICAHPMAVMSEPLRPDQRVDEVDGEQDRKAQRPCRLLLAAEVPLAVQISCDLQSEGTVSFAVCKPVRRVRRRSQARGSASCDLRRHARPIRPAAPRP